MPLRIASGRARSRKAWSTIVSGWEGSQKTAIRFSVIPRSVSMWKKPGPPSSAYLPASSATPKVVLEAPPARARAVQAHARTAVIRHMPFSSADQAVSLSARLGMFEKLLDLACYLRRLCGRSPPSLYAAPPSRRLEHRIEEFSGSEADGIVRRQAGFLLGGDDRSAGLFLRHARRVEGDRGDRGRPELQRHALVEVDQLRQAHDRRLRRIAFDDRPPHLVTEDVEM